ncbi:MAG: hypothetical protein P4L55_14230 [Syntrophobacteraceae bacterium]|jgi:hypothetical protein|nr:hypothetical protein [Syntrophobacteraceae bacterium]
MTALYMLTGVISSFGALMSLLLVMILQRLSKLEDKLDGKQEKLECERREERFCQSVQDIWDIFNKHSHEGLPPTSKVTR